MASPFDTLRAVLFDLDGTLIETHIDFPAMTQAMCEMARDAQIPDSLIADQDILGIVAVSAQYLTEQSGTGEDFRRTAFARLEVLEEAGCANPRIIPGAEALLAFLKSQGIRVGVVTRNCRRVSQSLLSSFGLAYDVLLTRDDVARTKPHPEHLWEALERLGQPPARAAMAGDHWMDVQAGKAAGCAVTLGVLGRHDAAWFAPCPPTIMTVDLTEILPLLAK